MSNSAHEIVIPSNNKRRRRDNNDNRDRLSDLPDSLLLHILSFLDSRYSVRTCVLSTRWKHLWKRVPTLILHSSGFSTLKRFSLFVSRILTLRDRSIALHSLDFVRLRLIEPQLKKIINYIYYHNTHIHQLGICVTADSIPILNCVSSCRALTSLKLSVLHHRETLFPKSLNLPLLASLDLTHFTFCGDENGSAEPFSAFPMLNSLVIHCCKVKDALIFNLSNRTLVNLDMDGISSKFLKIYSLSTPSLSTFTFHYRHDRELGIGKTHPILNCISSCWPLTSLSLKISLYSSLFPKSLNLPLLASLYLEGFTFCVDENGCAEPFSVFPKLNSLVIRHCNVKDAQIFNISNRTLVNLDMHDNSFKFSKIELSTPSLSTFTFHDRLDQELGIRVPAETHPIFNCISSCWALTSLRLSRNFRGVDYDTKPLFPKSLNLPLLASLILENFAFCGDENGCAEPFSAFPMLNSLVIRHCNVKDAQIFNISNRTLVNLDMHDNSFKFPKIELSTPSLSTFTFPERLDQKICGSGLSRVKQVNIDEQCHLNSVDHGLDILSWLQDLANVESLKVTSITLQILSLVPDLLEVKLLSLCNLKSLEIKLIHLGGLLFQLMKDAMLKKAAAKSHKEAAKLSKEFEAGLKLHHIPDGIVDFLLQNSPSVEVNILEDYPGSFNLKQVTESIKGAKIIKYHSKFAAPSSPSSSSADSSSAESASAIAAAPPNLHFCRAKEMVTNIDNGDSTLWPDFVTKAFIEIMVYEVTKGNMSNDMFHARTWNSMTTWLNSITNSSYKAEQLKEKMHSLRAMFHEFYLLLQNTGFKWNTETNTVFASEEVWQNYLKTHDKASQFLNKGCDHYKLLEIIFNQNNEAEVLHHVSTQDRRNTDKENEFDNQNINTGSANHVCVDNDDSYNDIEEVECIKCRGKQKSQVKDHTSRKESASGEKENALACGKNVEITCSLTKCVVALEEIKDISDDIYGKALEKFKDPDWREMFMAMSNDRKRGWLCRL